MEGEVGPWASRLRGIWTTIGKIAGFDAAVPEASVRGDRLHSSDGGHGGIGSDHGDYLNMRGEVGGDRSMAQMDAMGPWGTSSRRMVEMVGQEQVAASGVEVSNN